MPGIVIKTPANLGALIKDRRRGLGLDQAELASRVGVSRLWINQVEQGKPGASIGLVLRTLMMVGVELHADTWNKRQDITTDLDAVIEAASDKPRP